jgi:hypothetical protein
MQEKHHHATSALAALNPLSSSPLAIVHRLKDGGQNAPSLLQIR